MDPHAPLTRRTRVDRVTTQPTPRRKHSKGTPHRGVRIPDELWAEFLVATKTAGLNASEVIRQLVREWLETNKQGEK